MIPLIVNDGEIEALKKHGEDHFINIAEMQSMEKGLAEFIGDRNGYSLNLEIGYRVVFSIEEHPRKKGSNETVWLRHMSISQAQPGRAPSQITMKLVGELLGFPTIDNTLDYEQCQMWLEDESVNVVCEVEKQ